MKIIGVKKIKVKLFKNNKGDLLKYISKKSPYFKSFGEVYFNEINLKKKKAGFYTKKTSASFVFVMVKLNLNLSMVEKNLKVLM